MQNMCRALLVASLMETKDANHMLDIELGEREGMLHGTYQQSLVCTRAVVI
jgi:hypothetical protein